MLGSEQITGDVERDEREREKEGREGREFILFYFLIKTCNEILVLICMRITIPYHQFVKSLLNYLWPEHYLNLNMSQLKHPLLLSLEYKVI